MTDNSRRENVLDYPIRLPSALEPPVEWAQLRQKCPVAQVKLPSGDEAKLVTRYDDVKFVLSDTRFTRPVSAKQGARLTDNEEDMFNSPIAAALPQAGQAHQQWRRLITKWFTMKRMATMRPRLAAMAERLVDDMVEQGHPADLKASLGFPLPVWAICDMLGVPDADRNRFSYWSDTVLNLTRYGNEEVKTAQLAFHEYMAGHVAAKRAEPGEDILSALIADSEGKLADATLVATGQGLLLAGHETTANMIGKMVAMLLADRRAWEALLADRSLVATTVEETLRFDANHSLGMLRYLSEPAEIAGQDLPAGTSVMCSMAAANRDETAFEHADEMDLARKPNSHLAFGAGPHSCVGQPLARTELQVVLEVLLDRLPSLDLAVPVERLRTVEGLVVGGLAELPVRW